MPKKIKYTSEKLICPFMSSIIMSNGVLSNENTINKTPLIGEDSKINIQPLSNEPLAHFAYSYCIGELCQLWNKKIGNCSIHHTSNDVLDVIGTFEESSCPITPHKTGKTKHHKKPSTLINLLKHFNDDHWDNNPIPHASVLVSEFLGGQDLDNNGEVFGQDFGILNGKDKPKLLHTIESHQDFPKKLPYLKKWSVYVNEIENLE